MAIGSLGAGVMMSGFGGWIPVPEGCLNVWDCKLIYSDIRKWGRDSLDIGTRYEILSGLSIGGCIFVEGEQSN